MQHLVCIPGIFVLHFCSFSWCTFLHFNKPIHTMEECPWWRGEGLLSDWGTQRWSHGKHPRIISSLSLPTAHYKAKKSNKITMCGSRKYPYPHHRGSLQIPRGRGILKAKIFKGKYEPKLEFPEGWGGGVKTKQKPSVGGVWIFSGTTQSPK